MSPRVGARWSISDAYVYSIDQEAPVSLVEIYATFAELAGLPEKKGIDRRSLVPLLKDP